MTGREQALVQAGRDELAEVFDFDLLPQQIVVNAPGNDSYVWGVGSGQPRWL